MYSPKLYETREQMVKQVLRPGWKLCEVGVFRGDFALTLLSSQPAELVLIDPWDGLCSSGDVDGNLITHVDLAQVYKNLPQALTTAPCSVQRGYSQDVLPRFPDEYFDFIYIDGNHSYEGVKSDLALAYKKTKMYGIIAGHDLETNILKTNNIYDFGVGEAVYEFLRAHPEMSLDAKALDGQVSFAIQKRPALAKIYNTSSSDWY